MASTDNDDPTAVTFDQLIALEAEQDRVDTEILRQHWRLSQPIFARRRAAIARIRHFWPLVLDAAPPEVEAHIQPGDALVFATAPLVQFDVERFEIEREPRSVLLRFEFGPANEWFEDAVLEKRFYWRSSLDGWSGLVSEPVGIRWKNGKDLTRGLGAATLELWRLWKLKGGEEKRKGFALVKDEEAYMSLKMKLEESDFSSHSFFTLFSFVSATRYVTAEESAEADEKEARQQASKTNGTEQASKTNGTKQVDDENEDEDEDDLDVSACPHGDDLATVLVEELYSNAIKYFTSAHEQDSDAQSEDDFEEDEDMDEAESMTEQQTEPPKKKRKQIGPGS